MELKKLNQNLKISLKIKIIIFYNHFNLNTFKIILLCMIDIVCDYYLIKM
jgi:hypothetical protein